MSDSKKSMKKLKKVHRGLTRPFRHNPIYGYWRARQLEGTQLSGPKPGVFFINSYRVRSGWGQVPVSIYPYDASRWPPKEPLGLDTIAKYNRIAYYQRVFSLYELKVLLSRKQLTQIAVPVTKQWYTAINGIIEMPVGPASFIENHAVQLVGYSDRSDQLLFRNSWGERWGDGGDGYLPYEYLEKYGVEAWHYGGRTALRPSRVQRAQELVSMLGWSVDQPHLNSKLFCAEIHDNQLEEKAAWMFVIETDGGLRVEDLFVRPQFRKKGFGTLLGMNALAQARQMDMPIDFLISKGDTEPPSANFSRLSGFTQKLGLDIKFHGHWGIKYVATPGTSFTPIQASSLPEKGPMAYLPDEYKF